MARTQLAGPARASSELPELAAVYWRPRVSPRSLARTGRLWTLSTVFQTVPFALTAVLLGAVKPITLPVGLILLAHAWIIPELYAARGANVVSSRTRGAPEAEQRAMLLLGDLIGHDARALYARTGLVSERGELGTWLVGQAGALLLAPGGRRVYCLCVKATDPKLPSGDMVAHLLLALRADESGFVTLANLAFSGAPLAAAAPLAPIGTRGPAPRRRRGACQPRGPRGLRMFVPGANAAFSREDHHARHDTPHTIQGSARRRPARRHG